MQRIFQQTFVFDPERTLTLRVDSKTNSVVRIEYMKNGKEHRECRQGPAIIQWHDGGLLFEEAWMEFGKLHNSGGPAQREYDEGKLFMEAYYVNGVLHREDGPALLEYPSPNHARRAEAYYRKGLRHRPSKDGPAITEWDANGHVVRQEFWVAGKRVKQPMPSRPHPQRSPRRSAAPRPR
ncbi:toxin-antitoxin system YwqK family antitoxin [Bradyrhizobium acaciae]|uniref:toxin-antitoxin system YwqK family antitoxin n=1 Tax=Bradyrhizobium acaciae TaxID=2683706 RepID=UPI001E37B8B8|nr:hypothetical protein [Bradyrhizobium acaciae]MCC8978880.1 hypothetical protein [Bradyrhizobium acaciae]